MLPTQQPTAPRPAGRKCWLVIIVVAFGALPIAPLAGQAQILHEFFTYEPSRGAVDGAEDRERLPEPGRLGRGLDPGDLGDVDMAPLVFRAGGVEVDGRTSTGGLPSDNVPAGPADNLELDLDTRREGMLRYVQVFEPTVAPWKRLGARGTPEQVAGSWQLTISDPAPQPLPVGGTPNAGDAVFTARMVLDGRPEALIPIPSVSPEMRIHRIHTVPEATVRFFHDGDGNFAAQVDRRGRITIHAEVSAPMRYFVETLPDHSERSAHPAPSALERDAHTVARRIGLDPDRASDTEIVAALRAWFLAFESGPFPDERRTGNDYMDLALGGLGVCRHRAAAFVLTARGLGLDARMVFNEAHAFTEVYIAGDGWRRVDLGGDAEGFEMYGDTTAAAHAPPGSDEPDPAAVAAGSGAGTERRPLDRLAEGRVAAEVQQRSRYSAGPPVGPEDEHRDDDPHASEPTGAAAAEESLVTDPLGSMHAPQTGSPPGQSSTEGGPSHSAATVGGDPLDASSGEQPPPSTLQGDGIEITARAPHEHPTSANTPTGADPATDATTEGDAPLTESSPVPDGATGPAEAQPEEFGHEGAAPAAERNRPRVPTEMGLDVGSTRAPRGTMLGVGGTLRRVDGDPVRRARVEVRLHPAGIRPSVESALVLGELETDEEGRYAGEVRIPDTLPPGRWVVTAWWPGDEDHLGNWTVEGDD